jgi:DNA ligase 1
MHSFAALYREIDGSTKTTVKANAIAAYLQSASADDAAWAIYLLSGNKIKQVMPSKQIRALVAAKASIPDWLLDETYTWIGDLAETLSAVVHSDSKATIGSLTSWIERISQIRSMTAVDQNVAMESLLDEVTDEDRFVLMKLLTGSMRVGVSQGLVIRAIAQHSGIAAEMITHRMMGDWQPSASFYHRLIDPNTTDSASSQPYPFALANPIEGPPEAIGNVSDFLIEWKWDGIRAQLIRRGGVTYLWSRGEERLDNKYPEVELASEVLTDCVLDGELLAWKGDRPLPFGEMQKRIGRKKVGKKLLSDVPVRFIAFDILERDGVDLRQMPQTQRRMNLNDIYETYSKRGGTSTIGLSEAIVVNDWNALAEVRATSGDRGAEGLVLKRNESTYPVGRIRGPWWKWKVEPRVIDAVLIYAQRGHGKRAALYSDYTFALWDNGELVPFAKAYSGLTDAELKEVDRFIRANTRETFGPVRSVRPELVMELAFENIQASTRHKCGLAVRFPRINRWRKDKRPEDANQLADLKSMTVKV